MLQLIEFVQQSDNVRVDRDRGIIRGARILGRFSQNGPREYTEACIRAAASKYNGIKCYLNHPKSANESRSVQDRIGYLDNVTATKDALVGDFNAFMSHPYAPVVLEAAANPKANKGWGFSHVAEGNEVVRENKKYIDEISAVHSCDICESPATSIGVFESYQPHRTTLTEPRHAAPALTLSEAKLRMAGVCDATTLAKAKREWLEHEPHVTAVALDLARKYWVKK